MIHQNAVDRLLGTTFPEQNAGVLHLVDDVVDHGFGGSSDTNLDRVLDSLTNLEEGVLVVELLVTIVRAIGVNRGDRRVVVIQSELGTDVRHEAEDGLVLVRTFGADAQSDQMGHRGVPF